MAVISIFKVTQDDSNNEVKLLVDRSILTEELAHEINKFCGGADYRLSAEGGDIYRTVARDFGALAMRHMLAEGGADFGAKDMIADQPAGAAWVDSTLKFVAEGWPESTQLGIKIISAYVECPDFDLVEIKEIAP